MQRRGRSGWGGPGEGGGGGVGGQQLKSYNSSVDALAPAPEDCSSPALALSPARDSDSATVYTFPTFRLGRRGGFDADARLRRRNADNKGGTDSCLAKQPVAGFHQLFMAVTNSIQISNLGA